MKLVVHEITNKPIFQPLVPLKNTQIGAIRPHIYIHNKPTGTLKVQVTTSDGEVIGESSEVDIQDITTLAYFHGYVRFDVSAHVKADVEYLVKIVTGGGYSFSESGYVGVCGDYDLRKYEVGYVVTHPKLAPFDIEIWSLSKK